MLNHAAKTPAKLLSDVWLAWGTTDTEFTACRLIAQKVEGQPPQFPDESKRPPVLTRIYEELAAGGAETQVGNPSVEVDQYGNTVVTIESIALSVGTATFYTVGTTTAPAPYDTAVLKNEQMVDDGAVRRFKRVYTTGGLLSQTDEEQNQGKLLLRTLVYLGSEPATPAGYTRYALETNFVNGLSVFTGRYAKGEGRISTKIDYRLNGKIKVTAIQYLNTDSESTPSGTLTADNTDEQAGYTLYSKTYTELVGTGEVSRNVEYKISADGGATGVTVTTIGYVTDPATVANPITGPVGAVLIQVSSTEQDGYKMWNAVYADGTGVVTEETETKENGKLKLYKKTAINPGTVPTPAATIGGTVTLVSTRTRNGTDAANGTIVVDYEWVEANGEVSRAFTKAQGGAIAFDPAAPTAQAGAVVCTIRYLTASSVTSDPTTGPTSFVRFAVDYEDSTGYRAWTVRYGYGSGLVSDQTETKAGGTLKLYHRTALGAAPATPSATIGGTVNLVSSRVRSESGYSVYDYDWAEGYGVFEERISVREGGLRMESWASYGLAAGTAFTPAGILVSQEDEDLDGTTRHVRSCIQKLDGTSPTSGVADTWKDYVEFPYPGRAKPFTTTFTAKDAVNSPFTAYAHDLFRSPPIEMRVLADITISYTTDADALSSLTYPLWNPTQWATMRAYWESWHVAPKSAIQSLTGYMAVGTAILWTAGSSGYTDSCLGERVYGNSSGSIEVTGGPSDPAGTTVTIAAKCEPAFTATDGTKYYRKTVVTAAIPTPDPLPV